MLFTAQDHQTLNTCTIPIAIVNGKHIVQVLIDSGADVSFISSSFARKHELFTEPIAPRSLTLANGSKQLAAVTSKSLCSITFQGHVDPTLNLLVCDLNVFDVILGIDWLKKHNPTIDWKLNTFKFDSDYCQTHCHTDFRTLEDVDIDQLIDGDEDILLHIEQQQTLAQTQNDHSILLLMTEELMQIASEESLTINTFQMTTHNEAYNAKDLMEEDEEDDEEDFSSLPAEFQGFQDVFRKKGADVLPPHRPFDLEIEIHPGMKVPFMPMYALTETESTELNSYLEENLARDFIQVSKSSAGAPILFVKKKDGTLRLCVDYRGLNKATIKNRYPLPIINDLLDKMSGAMFFSKIDLRGAYNLVRIKEGDEWKTAFRTKKGLFEYKVMPFGLCNAPAAFQGMMDVIFKDFLDDFLVILLDDLGIYSKTREQHTEHISKILTLLRKHGLYAKLSKCEWFKSDIELLGHRVGQTGISMCGDKVDTIANWPILRSVKEVQSFMGLANYYRRFIDNYAKITLPLTWLLRQDVDWQWNKEQDDAFNTLKLAFTSMPVLQFPDLSKPFILECDASDFALGAVLSQTGLDGRLHPNGFYSRKFKPAEINYDVYDKELLAIIVPLCHWRQYLCGARHKISIFTDHRNLTRFQNEQPLSRRQARYATIVSEYDFDLIFRAGSLQGKPDALSRRKDYEIVPGDDNYKNQFKVLLNKDLFKYESGNLNLLSIRISNTSPNALANLLRIQQEIPNDSLAQQVIHDITDGTLTDMKWSLRDNLLYYGDLLYVPDKCRKDLLLLHHDAREAGHKGLVPTKELIARNFWFPKSSTYIKHWIDSCQQCLRSKTGHRKPYGELRPLQISEQPWKSISMDFIVKLPLSNGYDSILVVVDRMTKMSHFIPCREKMTAAELVVLMQQHIFSIHGLPTDIVSDRGSLFVSAFWKAFLASMGVKSNLSTAYHPETDGQTERINSILKTFLRLYVNYNQDDWMTLLCQAEFTHNNTYHSATHTTPFYANYGFHPNFLPTDLILPVALDTTALKRVELIKAIQKELVIHLRDAAVQMKIYADRKRQHIEPFKKGDLVFLSLKDVQTQRPSQTLDYRNMGPLKVIETIGETSYRLELPPTCKRHDVYHVSLLSKCPTSTVINRTIPPPPTVIIDSYEEHVVEAILDSRRYYETKQYLTSWKGLGPERNTWQDVSTVEDCEALELFIQQYPKKEATLNGDLRRHLSTRKPRRHATKTKRRN